MCKLYATRYDVKPLLDYLYAGYTLIDNGYDCLICKTILCQVHSVRQSA